MLSPSAFDPEQNSLRKDENEYGWDVSSSAQNSKKTEKREEVQVGSHLQLLFIHKPSAAFWENTQRYRMSRKESDK